MPDSETAEPQPEIANLQPRQLAILMGSVLIVALCGIVYELIIATVSSYLLGNSVFQFSITIGLFMFAMGIGAYLSKLFIRDLLSSFVMIEIAVALIGGVCCTVLFLVFPMMWAYTPVMYTWTLIIGALVGLEIPLLTRILSQHDSLRNSIATVLSLDYVGALVGSVAFPLLLLPHFGLFRASYAIGLLNISIAYFALVAFRHQLKHWRLCFVATVIVSLILFSGLYYSSIIRGFAEGRLFADTIIFERQTIYQRIVLTRNDQSGKIRLFLDGHLQFAQQDEYRYHEALVHPVMSFASDRSKVLLLGAGDGLAIRELLKYDDVSFIHLVDIDPVMTEISRVNPIAALNQHGLDHEKVTLFHEDAFNFVRHSQEKYDRVIIDLPDPHNEALDKLYSVEFYRMLRNCLAPGGYVVTQSSSPFFTRGVFWTIVQTIEGAQFDTLPFHVTIPSFGIWGFTLATADGDLSAPPSIQVPTRFLSSELFQASLIFPEDTARIPTDVNSLTQPRLYYLYEKEATAY